MRTASDLFPTPKVVRSPARNPTLEAISDKDEPDEDEDTPAADVDQAITDDLLRKARILDYEWDDISGLFYDSASEDYSA